MRMWRVRAHDVGGDSFAGYGSPVIQCCFVVTVRVTSRQPRVHNITKELPFLNYKVSVLCRTVATVARYAS